MGRAPRGNVRRFLLVLILSGCGGDGPALAPGVPVAPSPETPEPSEPSVPAPRTCSDERELAINKGFSSGVSPLLVHEWTGEPFKFYFDASISESMRGTAELVLAEIEELSEVIEDQIGYSILESAGWIPGSERGFDFSDNNITRCEGWRHAERPSETRTEAGTIVATVHPADLPYAAARSHCAVILWGQGIFKTNYDAAVHEVFHLFGFVHSPLVSGQSQAPPGEGVQMSRTLSGGWPAPLGGVTYEDIDALRCIFPAPD